MGCGSAAGIRLKIRPAQRHVGNLKFGIWYILEKLCGLKYV